MIAILTAAVAAWAVAAGLTYTAPSGWTVVPTSSSMRVAQFTLPRAAGDTEAAEMILYYFGGSGGSVEANIERWLGQMQQPDGRPTKAAATRETRTVNGFSAALSTRAMHSEATVLQIGSEGEHGNTPPELLLLMPGHPLLELAALLELALLELAVLLELALLELALPLLLLLETAAPPAPPVPPVSLLAEQLAMARTRRTIDIEISCREVIIVPPSVHWHMPITHTFAPLQLPSFMPSGVGVQVPCIPETLQALQTPTQVLLQQNPSMQ